jgi:hypothetical protein
VRFRRIAGSGWGYDIGGDVNARVRSDIRRELKAHHRLTELLFEEVKMPANRSKFQLLIPLVIWCMLVLLAYPFSQWQWIPGRTGMQVFHLWWVGTCTFVMSSGSIYWIWRKTGTITISQWCWYVIPFLASLFFVWKAGIAIHGLAEGSTAGLAKAYTFWACAFIGDILLWIIGFPYEIIFGFRSRESSRVWKFALIVAASAIVGVLSGRSIELLRHVGEAVNAHEVYTLQAFVQRATVAVYIFLMTRIFLPLILSSASRDIQNQRPTVGVEPRTNS